MLCWSAARRPAWGAATDGRFTAGTSTNQFKRVVFRDGLRVISHVFHYFIRQSFDHHQLQQNNEH